MTTIRATLFEPQQAMARFQAIFRDLKGHLAAGHRFTLTVKPETRSLSQNSRMWAMLDCLAKQISWHGQHLSSEDWKCLCTAGLKGQRIVPGLSGGFVVLGDSTSNMTIEEMSTLMDYIEFEVGPQFSVEFGEVLAAEPA